VESKILRIEPPSRPVQLELKELIANWNLILILTRREIKIRYKQRIIGGAWVILQPVLTMVIFTILFGYLMNTPTDGSPYPVFTYVALVPWTFFTHSLTKSTMSLRLNTELITKVYFPRLVLPIASVLAAFLDFIIAFSILIILMFVYDIQPTTAIFFTPVFVLMTIVTALSVGLWLAAISVEYRDVENILPFIIQTGLFVTPVAYSSDLIPEKWQWLYALNPMTGVVEGFRWALLGKGDPPGIIFAVSFTMVFVLLIGGLYFFKKREDFFADMI